MKGTFIVFEGGEGSGKTTHSKRLAEKLRADGYDVLETREPGGSSIGPKVRDILLHTYDTQLHDRAELLLFLAERAQHVAEVVVPALEAGKIVICDRFSGSTFAYQLGARQLPDPEFVKQIDAYARGGVKPDAVLFLDVPVEEGLKRRREHETEEEDRLDKESVEFHQRVRDYFHELAKADHWHTIDSTGDKDKNTTAVYNAAKSVITE